EVPLAVDTLARGTSEASADMLVAARSVVGSSRRGTSATSAADMASSAITTTVTDSAASSPWAYRSASHPIPSIRRTSTAPIRTAIPPRPGTTPRTVTGVTATSRAAPERRLRGRGSSSPQANLRGARHAVDARMNDGDAGLEHLARTWALDLDVIHDDDRAARHLGNCCPHRSLPL